MKKIKIGLYISLLIVISLSIIGFYFKIKDEVKKEYIKKEIENIERELIISNGNKDILEKFYKITIFDEDGIVTYDSLNENKGENFLYKEETTKGFSLKKDADNIETLYVVKKKNKEYIRIAKRFEYPSNIFSLIEYLIFAIVLGGLVIALFTETTFTPISYIINFTKEIEKGNYKARITYFGEKDIEFIAKTLNHMAEAIDKRDEELKNRTKMLTEFIKNLPIGIALIDRHGKIVMCNPILEIMTNSNITENKYYYETIRNSKIIELINLSFEKKSVNLKIPVETNEDFIIYNFATYNVDGNIILIASDITEEEKLSRLKSRFISDVTHEFKTPLSIILGYTEILNERVSGEEKYYVNRIKLNIERLNEIISDLVKIEKIEDLNLFASKKELVINDIIKLVIKDLSSFAERKNIKLIFEEKKEAKIDGIEELLYYSFYNIVENGIKYHDKKENGYVRINIEDNEETLNIYITDNGPGIPPNERLNIFRRFYRINKNRTRDDENGGSGLGLSIVREAIKIHEGKVICEENKYENGSCFIITLPKNRR
ncbi:MAG TPA: ATP-binding protein [Spirochaetota bacterium]|nr:ATP-binding protein [Spirochaetota bacterium]HOM37842.1 ATP-binding protein [Spirochaetota bacterium]HPQ49281.1 ATP-binding protein [Spirochaetota bacterium]